MTEQLPACSRRLRTLVFAAIFTPCTAAGFVQIPVELVALQLDSVNPVSMPFVHDPANALGDSVDGFGFLDTQISVTLAPGPPSGGVLTFLDVTDVDTIPDGAEVDVDSILDVFPRITFTDIDTRPGRDFAPVLGGGPTFVLDPVTPWFFDFFGTCTFDTAAPNGGCVQSIPERSWIRGGSTSLGDVNGNGSSDTLSFGNGTADNVLVSDSTLPGTPPIFEDGFESGDTSSWSANVNPSASIMLAGTYTLHYESASTVVPLPPSAVLLAAGAALIGVRRRRRADAPE